MEAVAGKAEERKPFYASMSTILAINITGKDLKDRKVTNEIDKQVEKKVKEVVDKLKISHEKFTDPDFGPNEKDEFGANSLYGPAPPTPAGVSKYPSPDTLRWDRPQYDDGKFVGDCEDTDDEGGEDTEEEDEFAVAAPTENEVWCMHGKLFAGGTSSNDVIQGTLGDCWFISALAIMGAKEELIRKCFWRLDDFKEFGLFVCVFYKDSKLMFVLIDDRIPVYQKTGKVVFGMCKDCNELWVPLLEKAYAKLHGCYKALIGGYSHYALADMTGFSPRLIGLKEGYMGFSDRFDPEEVWKILIKYMKHWESLVGCSIQAKASDGPKVEASAGDGLIMGHAYSFLDVGEVKLPDRSDPVRLVKLRNPWGRGEWEGPWSDNSDEFEKYEQFIKKVFVREGNSEVIESNTSDGTFFMEFKDWIARYTSLFVAVNFPHSWFGQRVEGFWSGQEGGKRGECTFINNPKMRLELKGTKPLQEIFVGLYINDSRLTMGVDYYRHPLYATALAFDIVTEAEFAKLSDPKGSAYKVDPTVPKGIEHGKREDGKEDAHQPPYMFGTTQVEVLLKTGVVYYIIPSLWNRKQPGTFFLSVYSESNFDLQGGIKLNVNYESEPLAASAVVSTDSSKSHGGAISVPAPPPFVPAKPSVSQFFEKKEKLREKVLSEMKRLSLTLPKLTTALGGKISGDKKDTTHEGGIPYPAFKRKMLDLGFSLIDLPDEDLEVLDLDQDKTISPSEFLAFVKEGLGHEEHAEKSLVPPPPPVDDLLFVSAEEEGLLTIVVHSGKDLRKPSTWLSKKSANSVEGDEAAVVADVSTTRSIMKYDVEKAGKYYKDKMKARDVIRPIQEVKALEYAESLRRQHRPQQQSSATSAITTIPEHGDVDLRLPSSPLSPKKSTDHDDMESLASFKSGGGRYHHSAARLKVLENLGNDAGIKLHTDVFLKGAEVSRTQSLGDLKKRHLEAKSMSTTNENPGMLRKPTKAGGLKKMSRTIEEDPVTMAYLAVNPKRLKSIQVNRKRSVVLATPVVQTESPALAADIFDEIINIVFTIASSRRPSMPITGANDKKGMVKWLMTMSRLTDEDLNSVSVSHGLQDIPGSTTPSSAAKYLGAGGYTPMPRNPRQISGSASVKSVQSMAKVKSNIQEAKEKIAKESKKPYYDLVYMRLLKLNCLSTADLHGDKLSVDSDLHFAPPGALVSYLFDIFDKNKDCIVSKDEFAHMMSEVHINLTPEESEYLFSRFDATCRDGVGLDCKAFCQFFEVYMKSSGMISNGRSLISLLVLVKQKVKIYLDSKYSTSSKPGLDVDPSATLAKPLSSPIEFTHFDNSIFTLLDESMASKNATILRSADIDVTDDEMRKISYVFSYDVKKFMQFINSAIEPSDIRKELELVRKKIFVGMVAKGCKSFTILKKANPAADIKFDEDVDTLSEIKKLWSSFVYDNALYTSYENVCMFFTSLIKEGIHTPSDSVVAKESLVNPTGLAGGGKATNAEASSAAPDDKVPVPELNKQAGPSSLEKDVSSNAFDSSPGFLLNPEILCRICADEILTSKWNKGSVIEKSVSFVAFHSYIATDLISSIESKLFYLDMLEKEVQSNTKTFLVHIFLHSQRNKFVILAREPVSGSYFRLDCDDSIASKLIELEELRQKGYILGDVYTPMETPYEDAAMQSVINRLRFVKTTEKMSSSQLLLAEDKKLIDTLQNLFDSANLPFFFTLNDLCLCFEVDAASAQTKGGVKRVVFPFLRTKKDLSKFLCTISCSLRVVISAYNGHERECLDWPEMVAHLTDYRNPFVSVHLLPDFLEEEDYVFAPYIKKDPKSEPFDDSVVSLQRGKADCDGGSFPRWESSFTFEYKPPKLTSCKVVNSTIARVVIDGVSTYTVIFIREGRRGEKKERFLFLTLYDPRSATEYQCGIQPSKDIVEPDPTNITKYDDQFASYVDSAVHHGLILVGPIITPHINITAYNEKAKNEEILGYCQMSISSLLSGHGDTQPCSLRLMYTSADTGKLLPAGEVLVEASFKRKKDIENEKNAKASVKAAQQARAKARRDGECSVASTPRGVGGATSDVAVKSSSEAVNKLRVELDAKKTELELVVNEKRKLEMKLESQAKVPAVQQSSSSPITEQHESDDIALQKLTNELETLRQKHHELEEENQYLKSNTLKQKSPSEVSLPDSMKSLDGVLKGDSAVDIIADLRRIFTERNNVSGKALQPSQFLRLLKTYAITYPNDDCISQDDFVECLGSFVIDISANQLKVLASENGIGSKVDTKYISIVRLEPLLTDKPAVRPIAIAPVVLPTVPQEVRGGGGKKEDSVFSKEKGLVKDIIVEEASKAKVTVVPAAVKKVLEIDPPRGPEGKDQKVKKKEKEKVAPAKTKDSVGTAEDDDGGAASKNNFFNGEEKSAQKAVPAIAVSTTRSASAEALRAQPPSAPSPERPRVSYTADSSSKLPLPPSWESRSDPITGRVFYVNHDTKVTQWNHPLEPPKKSRKKSDDKKKSKVSATSEEKDCLSSQGLIPVDDAVAVSAGGDSVNAADENTDANDGDGDGTDE